MQASLPPWTIGSPFSPCTSPVSSSMLSRADSNMLARADSNMLARAEGNQRASKSSARLATAGSKSLGRASATAFLRQGDAALSPPPFSREWDPELDAKATTLSRSQSGRGSIKKPALTKAALMRLAAGEKKAEEEERRRQRSEFGAIFDQQRSRATTPSSSSNGLMTRSAYGSSWTSGGGGESVSPDPRRCRTPQLGRRRASSRRREADTGIGDWHSNNNNNNNSNGSNNKKRGLPSDWRSFHRVEPGRPDGKYASPSPPQSPPPMVRAEPDGVEDDKDSQGGVDKALGGDYDHSKEYDPFETAERQMQELLFGSSALPSAQPGSTSTKPIRNQAVQKPQPVRPALSSAGPNHVKAANSYNSTLNNSREFSNRGVSPNYQSITKQMAPNRINPNSAQPMLNQTITSSNRINASSDKKTNWRQFLPSLLSFQQPGNSRQAGNNGNNGNNDRQQQKNSTRQENAVKQSSTGKARSYNLASQ